MARIHVLTSQGQPLKFDSGAVYIITDSQWSKLRSSEDGVRVDRPGTDYLTTYDIAGDTLTISDGDLLSDKMTPKDTPWGNEEGSLVMLLRGRIQPSGTSNDVQFDAWWSFNRPIWRSRLDLPRVQDVYVYFDLNLWTEMQTKPDGTSGRHRVVGPADKQASFLVPPVNIQGDLDLRRDRDPVILVHGIGGEDGYFNHIPDELRDKGYDVWEFYYPNNQNIRLSAGLLSDGIKEVLTNYHPGAKVNLVGHSMGGLVTRAYLEGLALIGTDESAATPKPYRGDVRKWVSLSSPQHGQWGVEQYINDLFGTRCSIQSDFKDRLLGDDYRSQPALKQLAIGSRFIWELNRAPLPPELAPDKDILAIAGTGTPLTSVVLKDCLVYDSLNDGAVDLVSASLLDRQIPLVTLPRNHGEIIGQHFPESVAENRNTSNLSEILARFFKGDNYNTGQDNVRITKPGDDPYGSVSTPDKRAGLMVRYVDKTQHETDGDLGIVQPGYQSPPNEKKLDRKLFWNANADVTSGPVHTVPNGPKLGFAREEHTLDAPQDWPEPYIYKQNLGISLGAASKLNVELANKGKKWPFVAQAGVFRSMSVCEDPQRVDIKNQKADMVSADSIEVSWETSQPGTAEVRYGPGKTTPYQLNDMTLTTTHRVQLRDLPAAPEYTIHITSTGACDVQDKNDLKPQQATADLAVNPTNQGPKPPTTSLKTATVLVVDVSGSMGESWKGGVKIESAKAAAGKLVDMLERESKIGGSSHQASLIAFSTNARELQPLVTDYASLRTAIQALAPTDRTNLGASLQLANQELRQLPSDVKRIIILLTDGMTNEGLSPDNILSGPVKDAAKDGTCIYTVGYGEPGGLDPGLLTRIAKEAGCGEYKYASTGDDLQNIYLTLRHGSSGKTIHESSGAIAQGQTTQPQKFTVPAKQGELHVTLNWPGSWMDLLLMDPSGRKVDNNYPGVTLFADKPPIYAIVRNPAAGDWQVQVFGATLPNGPEPYSVVASTRESANKPAVVAPIGGGVPLPPTDNRTAFAIIAMTLLAGLIAGAVVLLSRQTHAPAAQAGSANVAPVMGSLSVTTPGRPPRAVPIRRLPFTIGRQSRCDLALDDPEVSRVHARLALDGGALMLEDLNSANGTLVNGRRIQRHALQPGDEVRIGQSTVALRL